MSRMLVTAAVVATLCVVYAGYARVMKPMLRSEAAVAKNFDVEQQPVVVPKHLRGVESLLDLHGVAWNGVPGFSFTRDGVTLIFDSWEPVGESGDVELKPFACLSIDPERPKDPFLLVGDSARIRFEEFNVVQQKFGKILGGTLSGAVRISGPDGLHMTGREFTLTERDLFSDHHVEFSFGPSSDPGDDRVRVAGEAGKVRIALRKPVPGEPSLLPKDLPAYSGIESVWLRKNVRVEILSDRSEPGRPRKPDHLTIACDERLAYDVERRQAKFSDNVRVVHTNSLEGSGMNLPGPAHRLRSCDELTIQFDQTDDADAPAFANFSLALAMRTIRARRADVTSKLQLISEPDDLFAYGSELVYDLLTREATLSAGQALATANAPPPLVAVRIGEQELFCPVARVRTGEGGGLVKASFPGPGGLRTRPDPDAGDNAIPAMQANWDGEVIVEPVIADDGHDQMRVTVNGQTRLDLASEQTRVTAPGLVFWVDEDSSGGRSLRSIGDESNARRKNPLRRVLARRGAHIVRPDLNVRAKELLELLLLPVDEIANPIRQASASEGASSSNATADTGDDEKPIIATAGRIGVTLGVMDRNAELLGLTAVTNVSIEQAGARLTDPPRLKLTGEKATLSGRGMAQQLVISGGPTRIEADGMRLTAANVVADRANSSVVVPGGGMLTIPVSQELGQSIGGASIASGQPLTIEWDERVEFKDDLVTFFGDVTTKQGDTQVDSDRLDVRLTRAIDFGRLGPGQLDTLSDSPVDLKVITFRHNVQVSSKEWDGTELKSLRTATMAELSFDRATQQIHGMGPGVVRQWTREEAAEGKSPAKPWRLSRVSFDGELDGNAARRWLRIARSVRALSGVVDRALDDLSRDDMLDVAGQPDDVFWIGCDTLEVSVAKTAGESKLDLEKVQVQASGRVEIEGLQFRSVADVATIDRDSGLVAIRGNGGNLASIWRQERPGAPPTPGKARAFMINLKNNTFKADSAAGFWGGR